MTKLWCKNCNYRFETQSEKKRCPYCGKESVMREPGAEELLLEGD
ncbi:MAG: hypothetical protein AABW50_00290 [Nanoarchaeota archaeon]